MSRGGEKRGRATGLIHHPYRAPAGFESPATGVHKASTVFFENTAAMRSSQWVDKSGYTYGLHGTPTSFTLEARLATLEGGTHALLAPSGLAAITLADIALLSSGDRVLIPSNAYAPGKNFARHELAQWGIAHAFYDPMAPATLEALLDERTRLVWIEPPGSVTLEFPDVPALVATVRVKAPRAVIGLDNTWGAGIAFDAFALGIDFTVHALTKYPSGGGDVMMGSLVVRDDDALYRRFAMAHSRLGLGVGANDVEAVLRALPSIALRYAAQDASARAFAAWCSARPEFAKVLHPALPGSPGHAHWAATCSAAAGLVSVAFDGRYAAAQVDAFIEALQLFRIGWSWAGPVSLAVPYDLAALRGASPGSTGTLVRFSVGLEDTADLIADVEQALSVLRGT